ncbi:MAG: hypothetical protein ACTSPY_07205 [Candidatus Helarchaeota archaeon]
MIHIAFLLHIYQPPCQSYLILKRISNESYLPIFNVIKQTKNSKITLNINGSLTELIKNYEIFDVLTLINELSADDKIRFTGSGMYHPILPLLPINEIDRQIQLNEEFNSKFIDNFSQKKGFFPPELCISLNTLNLVKDKGYNWIIADGVACPKEWPTNKYYKYDSLPIFFRDSIISNQIAFKEISPNELVKKIKTLFDQDYYLIFALDGETFGHHIKNYEISFLQQFINLINDDNDLELVFIDEILDLYPSEGPIRPNDSSWSTTYGDLEKGIPYPLWANPTNHLHIIQSRLQELVYEFITIIDKELLNKDLNNDIKNAFNTARYFLDKGEFSCKLWWACPEHFDYNIIVTGNQYFIKSAVNGFKAIMELNTSSKIKNECRKLYELIISEYQFLLREIGTNFEYTFRFGHY